MNLQVECNGRVLANVEPAIGISITPPIDEDFWLMRVPVSEHQAIVCFPKFFVIGIGFQKEEDWNTNLPSSCDAAEIFDHIKHNKGDDSIPDERCIAAIKLLQEAIAKANE